MTGAIPVACLGRSRVRPCVPSAPSRLDAVDPLAVPPCRSSFEERLSRTAWRIRRASFLLGAIRSALCGDAERVRFHFTSGDSLAHRVLRLLQEAASQPFHLGVMAGVGFRDAGLFQISVETSVVAALEGSLVHKLKPHRRKIRTPVGPRHRSVPQRWGNAERSKKGQTNFLQVRCRFQIHRCAFHRSESVSKVNVSFNL